MKVHLVGGFTGSGKTTAITNACKILAEKNILTHTFGDKEEEYFLADCPKNEFSDSGAPYANNAIGCLCCNYTQLDSQIDMLNKKSGQSVLFGDYGGTCTNLISTLLKPLRDYKGKEIEVANFSTFVDAKLLLLHLKGLRVPLSLESKYSWDKHLEESQILVINRIDLIPPDDLEILKTRATETLSSKKILFQNSLHPDSVSQWIECIGSTSENKILDAKDGNFAWLDEEIQIIALDDSALEVAYDFMHKLSNDLVRRGLTIEYLKFLLYGDDQPLIIDHVSFLNGSAQIPAEKSGKADLVINARIQSSPGELRKHLFDLLKQFKSREGIEIIEKFISYLQ